MDAFYQQGISRMCRAIFGADRTDLTWEELVAAVERVASEARNNQKDSPICERCWTNSWQPCEPPNDELDKSGNVPVIPDTVTGGWMTCGYCASQEARRIIALAAKSLGDEAGELAKSLLKDIPLDELPADVLADAKKFGLL